MSYNHYNQPGFNSKLRAKSAAIERKFEEMAQQDSLIQQYHHGVLTDAVLRELALLKLAKELNDVEVEAKQAERSSRDIQFTQEKKPTLEELESEKRSIEELTKLYEKASLDITESTQKFHDDINGLMSEWLENIKEEAREIVSKQSGVEQESVTEEEIQEYVKQERKALDDDISLINEAMCYQAQDQVTELSNTDQAAAKRQELAPVYKEIQSSISNIVDTSDGNIDADAKAFKQQLSDIITLIRSTRGENKMPMSRERAIAGYVSLSVTYCQQQKGIISNLSSKISQHEAARNYANKAPNSFKLGNLGSFSVANGKIDISQLWPRSTEPKPDRVSRLDRTDNVDCRGSGRSFGRN